MREEESREEQRRVEERGGVGKRRGEKIGGWRVIDGWIVAQQDGSWTTKTSEQDGKMRGSGRNEDGGMRW